MILWVIEIDNEDGSSEIWTSKHSKPMTFWTKKSAVAAGRRLLKGKKWHVERYENRSPGVVLR